MPMMNPNAIGAAPAQGNPQQGKGQTLPPEQMAALRKDPEIVQAVAKVLGKPIDLAQIPDNLLVNIAGMVHKLGVDGAVSEFTRKMPPQILQQLKASV